MNTTQAPHFWRATGPTLMDVARLLDSFIQLECQLLPSHPQYGMAREQADEARWASANRSLWLDIIEARTAEDLRKLADDCDDEGYNLSKEGRDWRATVWFVVADALRKAAGEVRIKPPIGPK